MVDLKRARRGCEKLISHPAGREWVWYKRYLFGNTAFVSLRAFPTGRLPKDWESGGRVPATFRQYSGFGGSEEWRIKCTSGPEYNTPLKESDLSRHNLPQVLPKVSGNCR